MLIDSHCHLTSRKFRGTVDEVLDVSRAAGVGAFISAGVSVADAAAAMEIAAGREGVYFAAGVHPHEAEKVEPDYLDRLAELIAAAGPKCVAVGEIGLDYHYDFSPRDRQRAVFAEQLRLAAELNTPAIVHTREAAADTQAALAPFAGKLAGVIHSFAGGPDECRALLDQGWFVGFSGIVTFNSAADVREAAKLVPLDRLLVETDAPYLSPQPVRKVFPNIPGHVAHTARFLAELRGETVETLAARTTANAARLFSLDIDGG